MYPDALFILNFEETVLLKFIEDATFLDSVQNVDQLSQGELRLYL